MEVDKAMDMAEKEATEAAKNKTVNKQRATTKPAAATDNKGSKKTIHIVDKIVDDKIENGKEFFKTLWQGYDEADFTWETADSYVDKNIVYNYKLSKEEQQQKIKKDAEEEEAKKKTTKPKEAVPSTTIESNLDHPHPKSKLGKEQRQGEQHVLSGINNVATDRVLLGLAHNLANRKENEEEGTTAAADIIEEVVRACKKPVSVKDYMGLTQALTMVAAAAPHHHPNLTPDDSSTNTITTTTAVTSKSADTPPRANTPDVVEVESRETTTATSCDTTPSPVLISPAPGSTTTTINNTTTNNNKMAAIRGLGKLKLSSDMMISSFENVSSTNVHDEYADGTVDFVNSVYGPDKSIVQLVEIGPVSIQWGETYRLYGVSERDGIRDVLQAGTHMWDKCAHILELVVEEDVKIKEETSSKKQECKAVDEMDMDEISKAIADEKAEKAAEVKKRIEEQAKKEPVFERVLLRGWVWNQFSFCVHRGAAFVILFCFRDYSLSGHNVNMRLALLSPEIGPLREEIRRFVF